MESIISNSTVPAGKRPTISIPRAEFDARALTLCEHAAAEQLSGVVLFDSTYILYFTGFAFVPTERPIAFVMNEAGEKALFVPRLEVEHARAQTEFDRIEHYLEYPQHIHPAAALKDLLLDMGISDTIGVDTDGYPWMLGYQGPTVSRVMGTEIKRVGPFIESLMAIKSEREIALIRESITWSNLAHNLLQFYTRVGATETEVSRRSSDEATFAMLRALGPLYRSQSMWWDGITALFRGQIGRNSAIPHALANNIAFRQGDVLVSGVAAPLWGYNSELERTMIVGKPSDQQQHMFEHVCRAQEIAFDTIRPGATCSDVDQAVHEYYESSALMAYWRHHTGHGLGLRYHEGPFLDIGDQTELRPGMIFSVEPGLYVPGIGGFRHADTVLVTETGAEVLTYYPRDLESLTIAA